MTDDPQAEPVNPCTRGASFCGQHGYECPPSAPADRAADVEPVCKFDEGCHRVVPCEPGCGASTAPLAAGFPLVQGRCPACGTAGLFLGSGGYVTCSNADCPEPDAATTVLEQYANEAHAPEHSWAAELHDPLADEWVPGTRYAVRDRAVNNLTHARAVGPTWRDGTPTQRRLVRATTTYTVEPTP